MKKKSLHYMLVAIASLFIASFALPAQADEYPILIDGSYITSDDNLSDIKRDAIKSGKVSYDPDTYTLTLENAVIKTKGDDNAALWFYDLSNSHEYTLVLKGDGNKLICEGAGLSNTSNLIIKGGGSVEMTSEIDCGIFVNVGAALTITDGCTITAIGLCGISGFNGPESLIIDGANIKAAGNGTYGSICDFNNIQLKNCNITAPADATVEGGNVMLNGSVCTKEIVITSTVTGIESSTVTTASAKHGTYTISGVKTETDFDKLPKGIYIVDGVVKAKR